jgi:DNA-binding response OmpR family regulator
MILIVDDERFIRDLLIDYLQDEGYSADGAAHGLEAIQCLRTRPFQLVLLDIMMPIMNGWQMLQVMRADPALATLPVVMMTAGDNVHKRALEQGAIGYLPKPLDLDALLDIVRYHEREQQEA